MIFFFALTLRERSAQASHDVAIFSQCNGIKLYNLTSFVCIAPERKANNSANNQANFVAGKAGNLALYEVKLVLLL